MEIKTCKYCGVEQPESNFEVANVINGKAYRRLKCTPCKNQTQVKRKGILRAWLNDFKKTRCCERCGYSDFRALTFHHRDSTEKEYAIADMVSRGTSIAGIQRELAKCSILCANCHAVEHFIRQQETNIGA